jgi:hypothetical protein
MASESRSCRISDVHGLCGPTSSLEGAAADALSLRTSATRRTVLSMGQIRWFHCTQAMRSPRTQGDETRSAQCPASPPWSHRGPPDRRWQRNDLVDRLAVPRVPLAHDSREPEQPTRIAIARASLVWCRAMIDTHERASGESAVDGSEELLATKLHLPARRGLQRLVA